MALRPRSTPRTYDVGHRVAVGGMGEIYEGQSPELGRRIAIKRVLKSQDVPDLKELFVREVAVAAMLEHPNVIEVLDAGAVGPDLYLIMEFVDGPSLAEVLEGLRRRRQVLPIDLTCGLMAPIARGLAHAHGRSLPDGTSLGIIHRDVAPENVLITRSGIPKLADFGLARLAGHEFTSPGTIRGRPRCLSPEQARGDHIDVRSDVFALGAMLFEMVSGQALYPNEALATLLFKVAAGEYESIRRRLPNADGDLLDILETALAVEPEGRYRSARELERALDGWRAARGMRVDSGAIAKLVADLGVEILRIRAEKREEEPGELEGTRLTLPAERGETATGDLQRQSPADLPSGLPARRTMSEQITGDVVPGAPPGGAYYEKDTSSGSRIPRVDLIVDDDPSGPFSPGRSFGKRAAAPRTDTDWSSPPMKRAAVGAALADQLPSEPGPDEPLDLHVWSSDLPKPEAPAAHGARSAGVLSGQNEVAWMVFLGVVLVAAALAFAEVWGHSPDLADATRPATQQGLLVLPPQAE